MLAYIYVAQSPLFTQTNQEGIATFLAPEGEYELRIWHPRLQEKDTNEVIKLNNTDAKQALNIKLTEDLLPSLSEYDDVNGLSDY